jgi:hypothetical protein
VWLLSCDIQILIESRRARMDTHAERLTALLSGHAEGIEPLTDPEWDRLLEIAVRNGVAQILFTCLKAQNVTLPPATAERIRNIHLNSAIRNMKLFHNLGNIYQAFRAAGVVVVPFKGAWLAEAVYGDIALRSMGDVDLWIQRNQLDAARQAMNSLGYSSQSKAERPLALQDAILGETQFFKKGSPMVEIHWNIFPGEWIRHTAHINEQVIWQRTIPYKDESVRQLSPEDAIIQHCFHCAVSHQMSGPGLRTLLDLDHMRQKLVINWETVIERASAWRVSTATWLVFWMYVEVFGDPEGKLPLQDMMPSKFRQKIIKRFISPQDLLEGINISSGPKRFAFLLALVDRPIDALYLIWRALVPEREWVRLRYGLENAPGWRIWMQRLWHPLRIAWHREI